MKKTIIGGIKDANGIFIPSPKEPEVPPPLAPTTDLSIDKLLYECLTLIWGTLRAVKVDIGTGAPSREMIMNLKDCTSMLFEFKKKEAEILSELSDSELEKLARDNK